MLRDANAAADTMIDVGAGIGVLHHELLGLGVRAGNPFRTFVHPPMEMRDLIERAEFRPLGWRRSFTWAVGLFERRAA